MIFNPMYFLFLAPAFLLAMWAQMKVRSTYAVAQKMPAPMSGAAAARHVLNSAGLQDVEIEMIPGQLSDHYDPSHRVLRLSNEVYQSRTLAAVGIAAHEAGHALQHAFGYAPLAIRNAAVPAANFGSGFSMILFMIGLFAHLPMLLWLGIGLFGCVVFFQLVNLPVEFNASTRAKEQLVSLGIIDQEGLVYVRKVLDAAAWTYVAATLQSLLTLLYLLMRAQDRR
ncbi:MAG TPA: zinc metallopeptidase [Pirellulales bacterium]|nr:zinc metallopeptidase [Pirellulales bacterium]